MNCPLCRLSFTAEDKRTLFLSTSLECKICWTTKDSSEFNCLKCGHAFCKSCLCLLDNNISDSELNPELWLINNYPTLNFTNEYHMISANWPESVIEYVKIHWHKYPSFPSWPQSCITYYKFYYNSGVRFV